MDLAKYVYTIYQSKQKNIQLILTIPDIINSYHRLEHKTQSLS